MRTDLPQIVLATLAFRQWMFETASTKLELRTSPLPSRLLCFWQTINLAAYSPSDLPVKNPKEKSGGENKKRIGNHGGFCE